MAATAIEIIRVRAVKRAVCNVIAPASSACASAVIVSPAAVAVNLSLGG
jgi:hypothetical protein